MRRCARLVHLFLLLVLAGGAGASSRLAGGAPGSAGAPDGFPACLEELLPCTAYLKTAKHPSQTCCTAMHNAAATEMPCLCRLFANPELLSDFNVTQDQMFRLPARCGLPVGCRAGATAAHDPVVEAPPPPPAGTHHHQHGASPRSSEFWSVWRVAALVVLGQMVPVAAVF
ncbi:non-specific lipid transfer protein GPI-anchored 7-like [Panicum virgatum]|uniref:Bifunctional inhibitor/plant lipid transfer protein/seed storage helical domain-containing protein n=1 Tax=Panicum virgatum TaxID=38727 RepID=A0A8T0X8Q0_PANVG|nr:non-specific lipid transfer protein GPI-anchored 7-like [Panicum virgatum]KAG2651879.1 hypothetical protein PVAP13_1NG310500 [Panicum virgatum]